MKIGVNIDNVLASTMISFCRIANFNYRLSLSLQDINSYYFWDILDEITEEQVWSIFNSENFYRDLDPVNLSIQSLNYLKRVGDIYLITSRADYLLDITLKWVEHYKIPYKQLITSQDKLEYVKYNPMEYFVDDCLETALTLSRTCRKVFLYDWPWNKTETLPENVIRAYSWQDIKNYFWNSCELY